MMNPYHTTLTLAYHTKSTSWVDIQIESIENTNESVEAPQIYNELHITLFKIFGYTRRIQGC